MEQSTVSTIHFDHKGDVQLLVDKTILVVSSKTMSLISDPWNAMLGPDGAFIEAQKGRSEPIPLPDDDLEALSIILHIAHLQFDKVPWKLEFDQLLSIAILTDKYQATHMVRPWLSGWVKHLKSLVDKDGYEEWLWIAWEFGMSDIFERIVKRLVFASQIDSRKQFLTESGKELIDIMPPDIIESILDVREVMIYRLLGIIYGYFDKFTSDLEADPVCKSNRPEDRLRCNAILFGSLTLELQRLNLWPKRMDSSEVLISVNELAQQLKEIKVFSYPTGNQGYHYGYEAWSHNGCNFTEALKASIENTLKDIPLVLLHSHKRHLKAQHAKCHENAYQDLESVGTE